MFSLLKFMKIAVTLGYYMGLFARIETNGQPIPSNATKVIIFPVQLDV
jgi:hypothetical protein